MRTTKNVSKDSQSPAQDLDLGCPDYEEEVLTIRPRCSVYVHINALSMDP
jgi:hypothetical protein